jgi:spore germination protein KC
VKKAVALLLSILLVLPLCACMDAREINTWTFPYMLGADIGIAGKIRFTVLIPTLQEASQGLGNAGPNRGGGDTTVISIDCPTLESGLDLINTFLSRKLNYTHAEIFVIGEGLAKQGITPFFEGMRISRQIRLGLRVIVVKGEASEFIKAFKPVLGKSIPGVLNGLMNSSDQTGLIEEETFLHVLEALKSGNDSAACTLGALNDFSRYRPAGSEEEYIEEQDLLPGQIARTGGNAIELLGTAVFNEDRLVGELDLGETRALLMVKGEFRSSSMTIHDPLDEDLYITTRVWPVRGPDISVSTAGDKPVINIKVYLEGSIQNQQSEISYMNGDNITLLEKAYAVFFVKNIGDAIKKCQGLGSDIFKFSKAAKKNFWTIQDWQNYGWRQRFPKAQVNIEVSFNMVRTGIVVENKPVQNAGSGQ